VNSATRLGHPRTGCVPAGLWAPRGAAADLAPDLPGPPRPMFRHVGHLPTGTPPGQHGRGPARRRARRSPEPVDGHVLGLGKRPCQARRRSSGWSGRQCTAPSALPGW